MNLQEKPCVYRLFVYNLRSELYQKWQDELYIILTVPLCVRKFRGLQKKKKNR